MFAYCGNNPVMFVDSLGLMPFPWNYWKNPWKKEETNSNMHGTFSVGIAVYTSPTLLTYGGEVALSTDAQGNTEIQFTYASGFTSGEGSSVMPFVMITDAPHVSKLRGFSVATGGVIPTKPAAISLDYNIIPDDANNETYQGITVGMGLGSGEAHVVMGNTWGVECSFNLLSIINNVYYSLFYGAD